MSDFFKKETECGVYTATDFLYLTCFTIGDS